MPDSVPAIEVVGLSRRFPGVVALDDVSLRIRSPEVHTLAGQNGAGKSTLIKILSGALAPSAGEILVRGTPVRLASPVDAIAQGIATITQEISLVPTLSVAENILIGRLPLHRGRVDWAEMRTRARRVLEGIGIDIDPDALVSRLTIAQQQAVEIARALSRRARTVIMDEPTSALAAREVDRLLDTVERLRAEGTSVVYVSHRMDEVFRISDSISVFREGRLLATLARADTSQDDVVRLMVGRDVRASARRAPRVGADVPVLEVEGLTRDGVFRDISFRVAAGEILGISGLVGAGRTEIVRAIFGADRLDAGTVRVAGRVVERPRPETMIRLGVGLVPEDRRHQGLVLGMSVGDNLSLVDLARRPGYTVRRIAGERAAARRQVASLAIRTPGLSTAAATLSGGNQQKIVIGKWLGGTPRVLIFDEPTRGIDIAAKAEVFRIIQSLADAGTAIIVISSEQSEILQVSDRIVVIHEGRISAELDGRDADAERLTQAAFGRLAATGERPTR